MYSAKQYKPNIFANFFKLFFHAAPRRTSGRKQPSQTRQERMPTPPNVAAL